MLETPLAEAGTSAEVTGRYQAKRELIVDVASTLINEHGVRGLSLAAVASAVGVGSTGIAYYYKRKEDLAAACFERSLDLLERQVRAAGSEPDLAGRIARLVRLRFDMLRDARAGTPHPVARLTDLRSTEGRVRIQLLARYFGIFRMARDFQGGVEGEAARLLQLMRTHVLLDNLYALPFWVERYDFGEWDRIERLVTGMLLHGIAPDTSRDPDRGASVARVLGALETRDDPGERFLSAATALINERGYRGTSVDLISSRSNVTKGSFYHHLEAKDDLVLRCFRRSLTTIGEVLERALAEPGSRLERLAVAVEALLTIQLTDRAPLLRSTALMALPVELQGEVTLQSDRVGRRIVGIVADAIIEGAMAPVDAALAGRLVMANVNAAVELRERARRIPTDHAVQLYASTLLNGLL